MKEPETREVQLRAAEVLAQIDGGEALIRLDEALTEVVEGVKRTHNKGSIAFRMTIKPDGVHEGEISRLAVDVDDIKTKVPKPPVNTTTFYPGKKGGLVKDNPRQPKLPMMDSSKITQPLNQAAETGQKEA